jgi:hypothetical protein
VQVKGGGECACRVPEVAGNGGLCRRCGRPIPPRQSEVGDRKTESQGFELRDPLPSSQQPRELVVSEGQRARVRGALYEVVVVGPSWVRLRPLDGGATCTAYDPGTGYYFMEEYPVVFVWRQATEAPSFGLSSGTRADEVARRGTARCATCGDTRVVSRLEYPDAKDAPGYIDTMGLCPGCADDEAPEMR